jgi:Ca2+-binding RTX toxin-like protein
VIYARDGRDVVCGRGGRDRIFGGRGGERAISHISSDRLSGGPGRDVLHGGKGHDRLRGDLGADRLYGGPGLDEFRLTGDGDAVFGGKDDDYVFWSPTSGGVSVDLQLNTARVAGNEHVDRIHDVADVSGTRFADVLRGDDKGNGLYAGDGDDVLDGRGGPDSRLLGGKGDDYLSGGPGYDGLEGGGGYDVLDGGSGPDGCTLGEQLIDCEYDQLP